MRAVSEQVHPDGDARACYRHGLAILLDSGVPFLVGGAHALERYAGLVRHSKDFDLFVHPRDGRRVLDVLAAVGYQTDLSFPHWLGKAVSGDHYIDVIFNSGNGICAVDDEWFEHAVEGNVLNLSVRLCPPEETIWSKAFVAERERYDGADIAHIIRGVGEHLAWDRLLRRFQEHWRVLMSHLVLFGFVYPGERDRVPAWVTETLIHRMQQETRSSQPVQRLCRGTLLSRSQYLVDIMLWRYQDARLRPQGPLTGEEVAHWTAAIWKGE